MDETTIRKIVIANALKYGKSDVKFVINKIIGEDRSIAKNIKEWIPKIQKIVEEINSYSPEKLKEEAERLGVEIEKKEENKLDLKPLPGIKDKVVLRFPPEPSGYMHLGHAISATINYLYKLKYNGKLILRFEDTDPNKVRQEFIDYFKKYLSWLEIEWDEEKIVSNDMEIIYSYAEKLIKEDKAYVCTCSSEEIKKNRLNGIACSCRSRSVEENLRLWEEMKEGKFKPGEAVLRLKGDLKSPDFALRDPNIMRIKETNYKPYKVWPIYDFENVVEDYLGGVTHIIRSNEFKTSVQSLLRKYLGFPEPVVVQYSRYNFKGTPFSKRKIRQLISEGKIGGWDDLRLPTMSAVERRGITPQAIREFVIRAGYSEASHTYDWDMLLSLNRKILDPKSKRMFFVKDPVKINLDLKGEVELNYHPDFDMGKRKLIVNNYVYISKDDLEYDKPLRLKDLVSIIIDKNMNAKIISKERRGDEKIIQWVGENNVGVKVLKVGPLLDENGEINPKSLEEVNGLAESNVDALNEGDIVQFERFGFVRLDNKKERIFIYSC